MNMKLLLIHVGDYNIFVTFAALRTNKVLAYLMTGMVIKSVLLKVLKFRMLSLLRSYVHIF